MLRIDRILYATDFSEESKRAFAAAVFLAEKYQAELHTVHVLALFEADPANPEHELPGLPEVYDQLAAAADENLRALGKAHASAIRVQSVQLRGISAAQAILDYAEDENIDLIVMGTHGRRGIRRFVMGSVTEEVIRLARCPVLAVQRRTKDAAPEEFERILVPVDFSKHSSLAVEHAKQLCDDYGAEMELVHVVEMAAYPDFYYPVSAQAGIRAADAREEAERRLEHLVRDLELGEVKVRVTIGRTAIEIAQVAEETHADLIVLSSHGQGDIPSMLIGSTAGHLIRHVPCSVLTLKAYGRLLVEGEKADAP